MKSAFEIGFEKTAAKDWSKMMSAFKKETGHALGSNMPKAPIAKTVSTAVSDAEKMQQHYQSSMTRPDTQHAKFWS